MGTTSFQSVSRNQVRYSRTGTSEFEDLSRDVFKDRYNMVFLIVACCVTSEFNDEDLSSEVYEDGHDTVLLVIVCCIIYRRVRGSQQRCIQDGHDMVLLIVTCCIIYQ